MKQKEENTNSKSMEATEVVAPSTMSQDLKTAVLIVSVMANLIVFTAWVALQVSSTYDAQVASILFG